MHAVAAHVASLLRTLSRDIRRARLRLLVPLALVLMQSACGGGGGGQGGGDLAAASLSKASGPSASLPEPSAPPASTASAASRPVTDPAGICTVTMYGDSIMHGAFVLDPSNANGFSILPEKPMSVLMALRPELRVTDRSVPGQTLMALSQVLPAEARSTRVVVIENGVIDSWQGIDPALFVGTLRNLVRLVKSEGRVPVLTGLARQELKFDRYHFITLPMLQHRIVIDTAIRDLAEEEGVVFADFGAARFDAGDIVDMVHPGKPYSDRLVQRVAMALDKACQVH